MLLKLDRDVTPYEIYQMVHTLMLLWQQAFKSLFITKYYHLQLHGAKYRVKNVKEETQ